MGDKAFSAGCGVGLSDVAKRREATPSRRAVARTTHNPPSSSEDCFD